jgi:hypothetical protein
MIGCSRSKIKSRLPKLINIIEKNSKWLTGVLFCDNLKVV